MAAVLGETGKRESGGRREEGSISSFLCLLQKQERRLCYLALQGRSEHSSGGKIASYPKRETMLCDRFLGSTEPAHDADDVVDECVTIIP